jgi:hypothetical protein
LHNPFGNYSKINASTYEDKIQELIDFYIEMIDVETFKNLYDVYSKREVHIEEKNYIIIGGKMKNLKNYQIKDIM